MQIALLLQALVGAYVVIIWPGKDILKHGVQTQSQVNKAECEAVLTSLRITKAMGAKDFELTPNSSLDR